MKKILSLVLFSAFYSYAYSQEPLRVVSYSPSGRTAEGASSQVITVTFNQPMVALSAANEMGYVCPIVIQPSAPGRCRWQGTQVLTYEFSAPLPRGREYSVTIPGGFKSKVGEGVMDEDFSWRFETERPELLRTSPENGKEWADIRTDMMVLFSLEVAPNDAAGFIEIREKGESYNKDRVIPLKVTRPSWKRIHSVFGERYWRENGIVDISTYNVITVVPLEKLKEGKTYEVTFKDGLPGLEGPLGLAGGRVVRFSTYYKFKFLGASPKECLPRNFSSFFSNPVNMGEFYRHLTLESGEKFPELRDWEKNSQCWGDRDTDKAVCRLPDIGYKPDSVYKFRVSGKLKDVFGNQLGKDESFEIATDWFCPSWYMGGGFGILESYLAPRHPLEAINAYAIDMVKARINENYFIPFYNGGMQDAGAWAPNYVVKKWDISENRNVGLKTFIDYTELLEPDKGGIIYTQIPAPPGYGENASPIKALDNVTSIGLTVKSSPDSTFVWTTYLKTGQPAKKISVEIRSNENKSLWKGESDERGFVDAPGWKYLGIKDWKRWERPRLWIFAYDKGGTAVMATDFNKGLEPWRFNVSYEWYPRAERYRGGLFTERGIYRPGETVFMKGVLKQLEKGDWASPETKTLMIKVTNSREEEVLRTKVALSEYDTFDYGYALKENSPTGLWNITVTEPYEEKKDLVRPVGKGEEGGYRDYYGEERKISFSESFRVEEFKPATFEVNLNPDNKYYLAGSSYSAAADGWYLFGQPMADCAAEWRIQATDSRYEVPGYENFYFGPGWWERDYNRTRMISEGSGPLDEKGKAFFTAFLDKNYFNKTASVYAEVSVTSPDRQKLFSRASSMVHPASFYLGAKPSSTFQEAGKKWSVEVIAAEPQGKPVTGINAEGALVKRQWLSVRKTGVGGRLEWVSERKDTPVSTFTFITGEKDSFETVFDSPGLYLFTVSAKDAEGRLAKTGFSFYVTGKGEMYWEQEDKDIIGLVPDKTSYKVGEKARILVKSPYEGALALVTVEREGILDKWTQYINGGAESIEVPIKENYLPNAYVSVILVKGRAPEEKYDPDTGDDLAKPQAKFGYANLGVDPELRKLSVSLETDREKYKPGEEVVLSLSLADESGKPSSGELAVYAVDEGVLSLTGYRLPDQFGEFYGSRPLYLATVDSRLHIIGQRNYGEKGERRGGSGGALAGMDSADLRKKFVPTAYWNASVITGGSGKAEVKFKLPDNLSKFRIMAVAVSGNRFGASAKKITVAKPLMLKPDLPRFAREGDVFRGGVLAHNYTGEDSTVSVKMELPGGPVSAQGEKVKEVFIKNGKAASVFWRMKAVKTGVSEFSFSAEAGHEKDGLVWKIPVKNREKMETAATSGAAENEAIEALALPGGASSPLVEITASASAFSGLAEGVKFLLEYPYFCLEQQISRVFPVITGADFVDAYGLGDLEPMKKDVREVFSKLHVYQDYGGGFKYWPDSSLPSFYLTTYVLEAAYLAGKEGYKTDKEVVEKAVNWLKTSINDRSNWGYPYSESEEYAARAYAVYVLALYGEPLPAYFSRLYEKRSQIPFMAKAYLAKSAGMLNSDRAVKETLVSELLNQGRIAPQTMHFEEPLSAGQMPWVHGSNVKTTAIIMEALLDSGAPAENMEKIVKWLINERKIKGRWRTTQENAWALRAFQSFYRKYEKEEPDFTLEVLKEAGGTFSSVWDAGFSGRKALPAKKVFDGKELLGAEGKTRLKFSKKGAGTLYYALRMSYFPAENSPGIYEGFEIRKEIKPLYRDEKFRAGSRYIVTLKIKTPQDRTFVALEDPLPGGFEIVDGSYAVESALDASALTAGKDYYWGDFTRSENYEDRILVFADYLTRGEHTYSYLVQATAPGEYYMPASWIEGMYEPEVFGRNVSERVVVK
ncbi:MAG: hypothetical protein COT17_05255 [Elusimicrobia bacterium CG08_land_8_20_14_0_20_51_18]|nr:MAG: hypothetical protein COT17_05255 [Elusimicrobia bacterium CG08_land_8_20_14_0_20_51_18]